MGEDTRDHIQAATDPWQHIPGSRDPKATATGTPFAARGARAAGRDQTGLGRSGRARATLWAAVGALVLVAGLVVAFTRDRGASQGYTVTEGSTGTGVYLTLPDTVGPRTQLMQDSSPVWAYYPNLLPASPADAYEAVGADYAAPTLAVRMVTLDVVFAKGDNGHRATFSLPPQGLVDLVTASMHIPDVHRYPAGDSNTLLECGTYATSPLCVWADASTLCFVQFPGVPGTVDQLAALAPDFERALIRP